MSKVDQLLVDFRETLDPGDFIVTVQAQRFVDYLSEHHAADLAAWLNEQAVSIIGQKLKAMLQRERSVARRRAKVHEFAAAAETLDEPAGRTTFETYYATSHDNLWRKLAAMSHDDLVYIADRYEANGKRQLLHAALFRHLAKQVGPDQVLADVLSEEQLAELQGRFLDS